MHEVCPLTFSLEGEDEAGEHEKDNADNDENHSQFFPGLVECVQETLKTGKVANHLEDAKDPQNPDLFGNFRINLYR